jgi:hypothetical protein
VPRAGAAMIAAPLPRSGAKKEERTVLPHPVHVITQLEQHHEEVLAEIARAQRASLAEQIGDPRSRRHWADHLAPLAILIALALLVAAGIAAA